MQAAVNYVSLHPGCTIMPVAEHIGPSVYYGYRTVHRAIDAGLIVAGRGKKRGTYKLNVKA